MLGFCFHFILICFFSVFLSSLSIHAEPCHIPNDTHTVHFNELLTLIIQKAISEIFTESKGKGKKKAYGELISFLRISFLKASDSGKVELGTGSSFKGAQKWAEGTGVRCSGVLRITGIAVRLSRHTIRIRTHRQGLLLQVAPGCAGWISTVPMGGGSTASVGKVRHCSVTLAVKNGVNATDLEQLSVQCFSCYGVWSFASTWR